jgi:hypothetical protein
MSEILSTYEKSFKKNEERINTNFKKLTLSLGIESDIDKNKLMQEIELLIGEQEKIIKQMEYETSSLINKEDYEAFNNKMISYRQNLKINKNTYHEMEEKISNKETLSGNNEQNLSKGLLKNEQTNYIGNLKLQEARRVLANTEDMGNKIIMNMDDQTNTMKNLNTKVKTMNGELDESNNILNKMKSRMKKNKKIIIYLSIVLLITLIIIFVYKFLKLYK